MKCLIKRSGALFLLILLLCSLNAPGARCNEEEPDPLDLSLYMDENIYEAAENFPGEEPVPARGFSLFMSLGDVNEDNMVEAGMTAYSDTEIIRSVQVHKNDDGYNIFGIYCGETTLSDAVDILLDCHYELKSSTRKEDGSYEDEYSSYMDAYRLYLTTYPDTYVKDVLLVKNVG